MKKTQRETYTLTEDFEDLTLFANESFDTQDVDLFEFTSEESSPLTRLKSIILSLDWEINDEILQELADEIGNLQSMWQGDKVAEVYLQGLAKIGNYIRTKGAYAHPNSIKLLLTFFYNFEKIISSPNITGDLITHILKGDVRKFKILQYQISKSEQGEDIDLPLEESPAPVTSEQPASPLSEETTSTQLLKAAILGLDWEVTDESLQQFSDNLSTCHHEMTDNRPALVILQGLQALGDYISDERVNSHPDAFTLLHSFNEALEQVTAESTLDDNEIQELLVDRINRLNSLKMVIASPGTGPVDEDMIAGVVEEISSPATYSESDNFLNNVEEIPSPSFSSQEAPFVDQAQEEEDAFSLGIEIDSIFGMEAKPAMETANEQYPDEILPPDAIHPVDDELADDLIGAQLSSKRGFAPALSDADESAGFNADDANIDLPDRNDLAEQLDFLFADTDTLETQAEPSDSSKDEVLEFGFAAEEPIAALADVEFPLLDDEENQQAILEEPALQGTMFDIESKLDSFFTDAIEESTELAIPNTTVEKIEQSLFFDEATSPTAALSDTEELGGFSEEDAVALLGHSPLDEIEQKLDFFFGDEPDELGIPASTEAQEPEEVDGPAPALSGFTDEIAEETPVAALSGEEEGGELSGALDAFFDTATESAEVTLGADADADDSLTKALEATLVGDTALTPGGGATFAGDLAALGAILPGAVRMLDRTKLKEADAMLSALQQESRSGKHKAIAQLLQSVVAMLSRLPAKSESNTEKLVNYLYEQLLRESLESTVLVAAIGRFSTWLQQAGTLMPLVPTASVVEESETQDPQFNYTAKELYFELAELRLYMNDEFAKLRHHLQHHH
ncbi:MAG: hypothetical protein PHI97_12885 [Desulfobulbus sp.]|nr:hypothetical protein [Desulfobulbus sp.]